MEEIWKQVPNYPRYQVSSLGRVKGPLKMLKPQIDRDGYPHVTTGGKPHQKQWLLHRLVCIVFHPDTYFEGAKALHRNHIPADCAAENLYWGGQSQNMFDMVAAGRCKAPKADRHYNSQLTWDNVREIRKRALFQSGRSLAIEFGISPMACNNIINNRSWKEPTDGQ